MKDVFGWPVGPWSVRAGGVAGGGRRSRSGESGEATVATIVIGGQGEDLAATGVAIEVLPWTVERQGSSASGSDVVVYRTEQGPVWWCRDSSDAPAKSRTKKAAQPKASQSTDALSHLNRGRRSPFARSRDRVGSAMRDVLERKLPRVELFRAKGCSEEVWRGGLLGVELAGYRFKPAYRVLGRAQVESSPRQKSQEPIRLPQVVLDKVHAPRPGGPARASSSRDAGWIWAQEVGAAMNLTRHLVNLPAADLGPSDFARLCRSLLGSRPGMSVTVLAGAALHRERMNLLRAVGRASQVDPCAVLIRYSPRRRAVRGRRKKIVFVGKGITFDTGGLDLKSAAGMRLMKKDMAGAAALLGLATWVAATQPDVEVHLYCAMAENAVGSGAYRPGDIVRARGGDFVEIHNTDAEGRLVMADLLHYATDPKAQNDHLPDLVIDISTLTGAMRTALGEELAGVFGTDLARVQQLMMLGQEVGDPCWAMPLYAPYGSKLESTFGDVANASDSPMAGAITAALFLERFVRNDVPWIHLDLYCWNDRARGALGEPGGNGQGVLLFIALLERLTSSSG